VAELSPLRSVKSATSDSGCPLMHGVARLRFAPCLQLRTSGAIRNSKKFRRFAPIFRTSHRPESVGRDNRFKSSLMSAQLDAQQLSQGPGKLSWRGYCWKKDFALTTLEKPEEPAAMAGERAVFDFLLIKNKTLES
jgi:hypothetical protein